MVLPGELKRVMDKLGHAFSSYSITEFLQARLRAANSGGDPERVALHSALLAAGLMSLIGWGTGFPWSTASRRRV